MKISELMSALESIRNQHGDLEVYHSEPDFDGEGHAATGSPSVIDAVQGDGFVIPSVLVKDIDTLPASDDYKKWVAAMPACKCVIL